jgi:quercetin dioxygenase-like cupin family protein
LAPGFSSETRSADTDQMIVCLSGKVNISTNDGETQSLAAGGVARLRKADTSTHGLSVVSDTPVHLMVVQLE